MTWAGEMLVLWIANSMKPLILTNYRGKVWSLPMDMRPLPIAHPAEHA